MKIKIKSREEIEKTIDWNSYHIRDFTAYADPRMLKLCGQVFEAEKYDGGLAYTVITHINYGSWCWHPDWYEVLEDFTQEDLMDIELMDETLAYFMEVENGN